MLIVEMSCNAGFDIEAVIQYSFAMDEFPFGLQSGRMIKMVTVASGRIAEEWNVAGNNEPGYFLRTRAVTS